MKGSNLAFFMNIHMNEMDTMREEWDAFIDEHAHTTFMQSWSWGVFEESCGHRVYRLGAWQDGVLVAVVQAIYLRSKRGSFFYIPHGPIFHGKLSAITAQTHILHSIHHALLDRAHAHKCSFIRLNSSLPNTKDMRDMVTHLGYKQAPIYLTSENAAVLELKNKTAQDILKNMRKTTRYLIQKGEREGVITKVDTTGEHLDDFMQLYHITTQREKFVGFNTDYIKKEFEAFNQCGNASIITSYHNNEPLASALILFTKKSAFYHQGASNHPKIPAPYVLQWEGIQLALKRGCDYYNFWGTYIPHRTPTSWKGLTLFKTGFGTDIWEYLPTHDYVIHPAYYITYLYEQFLRKKRGV